MAARCGVSGYSDARYDRPGSGPGVEGATRVVFVTAFDAYAVQAFEQEAIDYVLKPVTAERLQRTVERVRRSSAAPQEDGRPFSALQRLLPAAQATPR